MQRRAFALLAAIGIAVTGCTTGTDGESTSADESTDAAQVPSASATPEPPAELPRGGREVFPDYRLVGYSGINGDPNKDLGRLTGDLDEVCDEITEVGQAYKKGRKILPVFEMITVLVTASPQEDGKYRIRRPNSEVKKYLRAARRCKGILLMNIQPGQSEFLPELKHYEQFLREPDVGVALDPEWAMDPGQTPGVQLGRTTGPELNKSAEYLAEIVEEENLPEKVMVFHQFNYDTIEKLKGLKEHEGVALVRSIDGLGGPGSKSEVYDILTEGQPKYIHPGFKLFYKEDTSPPYGSRLMTPQEVMALKPRPEYILYE